MSNSIKTWDLFISHASEDKNAFVRPLVEALQNLGVNVWYDEFTLRLGDSLSRSIDKGLESSNFGLVVISPYFLNKRWTEYELRGLISREVDEDRVVLPIWHGVTRQQVVQFSPPLADKIAANTDGQNAADIAIQILREVRPDLYAAHPRAKLKHISSGAALLDLQQEIERMQQQLDCARDELAEYRCPYCASELNIRIDAPIDGTNNKHWDVREIFGCGHTTFGGQIERLCALDPRFPKFDEYELRFYNSPDEPNSLWLCCANGKTKMAQLFDLPPRNGRTREEAEAGVRKVYESYADRRVG